MPVAIAGLKVCTRCGIEKSTAAFSKLTEAKDGLREHCRECAKMYNTGYYSNLSKEEKERRQLRDSAWKKDNKERMRKSWFKSNLKKSYGMTVAEYEHLVTTQNGVCAICRKEEVGKINGRVLPLSVDHDHNTGKVRELLCGKCNKALGGFNDDPLLLKIAYDYLIKHAQTNIITEDLNG